MHRLDAEMGRYARPKTVDEALNLLAEGSWRLLAGGTDVYPAQAGRPIRDDILDIGALHDLRGIRDTGEYLVIGARTTWSDIVRADLPPAFRALAHAAREVGSVQIQNRATVAGNLCNASPAADGVPPLLLLDAEVELSSSDGARHLALPDFILGNRRTARLPNELVTAIRIPAASVKGVSTFLKLGARRYLVISIAMVAAKLEIDHAGNVSSAAVAVGACSAVAQRLTALEAFLTGARADEVLPRMVTQDHLTPLAPIDDVRGSAAYRRTAALEVVQRAIAETVSRLHQPDGLAA